MVEFGVPQMKIFLKSSDVRSLDFAVGLVLSKSNGKGFAIPMPSLKQTAPNGTLLSHVSRRLVLISDVTDDQIVAFQKLTLPSTVEIEIA